MKSRIMCVLVVAIISSGSSCLPKEIQYVPRCDVSYIPRASIVPEIPEEEMESLSDHAYQMLVLRDALRKQDFENCVEVLEKLGQLHE